MHRSLWASKMWIKKHQPAPFRETSMILWSLAKRKKKTGHSLRLRCAFSPKADHQKEGICKWQSVHRVDGQHGGCTGQQCDYFLVPQEAVVGLKAQLIRSCSRKLWEERQTFGKNAPLLGQRDDFEKLEIELTERLFVGGQRVCVPALPNGTQTQVIKFGGTNISIKVSPPWPSPALHELQFLLCACMCVSIHEWAVNDWHQQTGILARAHSSLTTSLLFMMRESAAVSPLSLFAQRFPQFTLSLFESLLLFFFNFSMSEFDVRS